MREIPLTAQTSGQDFQDLGEILTELTQSGISKNNQFNTVLSVLETINDVYFAQALLRNATSTLEPSFSGDNSQFGHSGISSFPTLQLVVGS